MELNNLLTNIKKTDSDTKKYLAIQINLDTVKTAAWEVIGTKASLLKAGNLQDYDLQNEQTLLEAIDASLAVASAGLEPEPNEAIFSLPDSWVTDSGIADTKKSLLKLVSDKLDLKPIGFVVTHEAIIYSLKQKHGQPPTCILIGIASDEITVTVINNGELVGTKTVGRSQDISADVEEGIARFSQIKTLPSTITLYNGLSDLEQLKQELISYNWQDRLPFLHIPKIDSLDNDTVIKAVVESAGEEVINSLQVSAQSATPVHSKPNTDLETSQDSNDPEPDQDSDDQSQQDDIPNLQEEFGFSPHSPSTKTKKDKPNTSPQDELDNLKEPDQPETNQLEAPDAADEPPPKKPPFPKLALKLLKFFSKSTQPGFPSTQKKRPATVLVGLVMLMLLFAGAAAAYWFLPKASVVIFLQPRNIERETTFNIDPALNEIDLASATLPGRIVDSQVSGQAQAPATGEKLVGDLATGTVTIFNRTNSEKVFEAGTRLTGPDSLAYTIDQEVSIASASTKEDNNLNIITEPQTAQVPVTAATIGAEFNLGSGTEFSVANFDRSSFLARAQGDITGGTSRQITAVSETDIANLREQLTTQLEQKIQDQLNQSSPDFLSAIILPSQQEGLDETLSADIGQEATTVSISATLTVQTMTYKRSDLDELIQQLVGDSIPQNYQLISGGSEIEVIETTVNANGSSTILASIQAKTLPQLDSSQVTNNIKGRYPEVTESYFKTLPGFSKVEIDITPKLPPRIKTFPRVAKNITVEFQTDQ